MSRNLRILNPRLAATRPVASKVESKGRAFPPFLSPTPAALASLHPHAFYYAPVERVNGLTPMEFSMSLRGSVLLLLSQTMFGLLLAGCTPPPPPPPPPPATSFDISRLQSDLQRHDPGARAGSVTRVRADQNLAAVSMATGFGSSKEAVKVDDPITFTDSFQTPVA